MRVTRLTVFSLFLVFLFVALLVAGCSSPPTTTTTTKPASSTSPTTTPLKTFELSVAPGGSNPPPSGGMTIQMTAMSDLLKARTNGQLLLKMYWSQSLVKQAEVVNGLQTGIVDIGVISTHTEPGKVPLALVGQMPGIGTDMWARSRAFYEICSQDPEKSELAKYNIRIFTVVMTTEQYIIANKPIRSVAELKGKKLATSGMQGQTLAALGGVGVAMGPTEQYEGLQKGTIDGIICPTSAVYDFKFYEGGKYFIRIPFGYRTYPVGVSMDAWNKLPADVQKAVNDAVPDMIKSANDIYFDADNFAIKTMQDNKVEFIEISAADKAAVMAVQSKQADDWAATNGDAGKKILADYRSLVDKYEKISPYKK